MAAGNLIEAISAGRFIQKKGLLPALLCCFFLAPCIFSVRAVVLAFPFQLVLAIFADMVLFDVGISLLIAAAVAGGLRSIRISPTLFCVAIIALLAAAFFRGVVVGGGAPA
jgi:hypothetical protein